MSNNAGVSLGRKLYDSCAAMNLADFQPWENMADADKTQFEKIAVNFTCKLSDATAQSRPGEEALRERIAGIIEQKVSGPSVADDREAWFDLQKRDRLAAADAILAALSIQALPVGGGGNKDHSSVGKLSSATKTPSREADGDREPAGVRE